MTRSESALRRPAGGKAAASGSVSESLLRYAAKRGDHDKSRAKFFGASIVP
jgi:hypothetical protein